MEVVVAALNGTPLRALRVLLKRRVSARKGGNYDEVSWAIQKKSRPSPSNSMVDGSVSDVSPRIKFGFGQSALTVIVECLLCRRSKSKIIQLQHIQHNSTLNTLPNSIGIEPSRSP
jgi:hypothetical protein